MTTKIEFMGQLHRSKILEEFMKKLQVDSIREMICLDPLRITRVKAWGDFRIHLFPLTPIMSLGH